MEPFILIGSTQVNAFIGNADYCCTLTEAMGKGGGQIPMIGTTDDRKTISYGRKIESKEIDTGMCLTARYHKGFSNYNPENAVLEGIRIRKLTPKECFRLMGFDDADVDLLIENGISNTQLYKMAGNSIVVNMLEFLFCQIFDNNNEIWV